jgi:hypothetical protein
MAQTPRSALDDGTTNANLFCSGHEFLPDGRLLVTGGHLADSRGLNQATIYDPSANTWTPTSAMNNGRWYPTAIALPSGSVLTLSGSFFDPAQNYVDPIPDGDSSMATVYLEDDGLPALDRWDDQFRRIVRQAYQLRGVEVTLTGTIEERDDVLVLTGDGRRPPVELVPLDPRGKVQWDPAAQGPQAAEPGETGAYDTLARPAGSASTRPLTVTGPLHQTQAGYQLQVRLIEGQTA